MFLVLLLVEGICFAKMAAPITIHAADTISFYKAQEKNRKLTPDEADKLNLALFAHDVFGVTDFFASAYESNQADKARSVSLNSIARSIEIAIEQKSSWDKSKEAVDPLKMKQAGNIIKKALGKDSYGGAWFSYQNGEKVEAKAILTRSFETSFTEIMKLTELTGFKHSNPLQNAEAISKALMPMSSEDEKNLRESQMKKMRTHISGLPNLQMMT